MLPHLLLDLTKLGKRSLCNRNKILNPERFHYPAASSRFFPQHKVGNTAHVPCKAIYTTTVHLLHVLAGSIGTIICGENIVSSGIQACVANVLIGSTSCSIWSHADKENSLVERSIHSTFFRSRGNRNLSFFIVASLFSFSQSSSFTVANNAFYRSLY